MASRTAQVSFSKGVISPKLRARFDTTSYQAGLAEGTNVVILKEGGLMKRVGTRLVAKAHSQDPAAPVRLVPFIYSIEQAYALEMGQAYMRPLALGGVVLETGLTITAITNAANAQVSAVYHGYSVGDQVYFAGVQGMVEINGRIATITSVTDANTVTIDIDTRGFSAFTADTGGITNTSPPAPEPPAPVVPPVVVPPDKPTVGGGGSGRGQNHGQIP